MPIKVVCDGGHPFSIPPGREKEQASNCPACGLLTWNPDRPKRVAADFGVGCVVGDSDRWNPWVRDLSPMDPPRLAKWKEEGKVRINPKTGNWEGYCPTRKEYDQRVKELGFTTDWGGQGNRANRREGRDEWIEEKASGTKTYFT